MEEANIAPASQRLRGRHVVITGAASGIGRAIAELFHREGAKLALIDRDAAGVDAVAKSTQRVIAAVRPRQFRVDCPDHRARRKRLGALDGS